MDCVKIWILIKEKIWTYIPNNIIYDIIIAVDLKSRFLLKDNMWEFISLFLIRFLFYSFTLFIIKLLSCFFIFYLIAHLFFFFRFEPSPFLHSLLPPSTNCMYFSLNFRHKFKREKIKKRRRSREIIKFKRDRKDGGRMRKEDNPIAIFSL